MNCIITQEGSRENLPRWVFERPFIDLMNKVGVDNFMRSVLYFANKEGLRKALEAAIIAGAAIYEEEGKLNEYSKILEETANKK